MNIAEVAVNVFLIVVEVERGGGLLREVELHGGCQYGDLFM